MLAYRQRVIPAACVVNSDRKQVQLDTPSGLVAGKRISFTRGIEQESSNNNGDSRIVSPHPPLPARPLPAASRTNNE